MQFRATFKEEANLSFSFFLIEQFNVKYDLLVLQNYANVP